MCLLVLLLSEEGAARTYVQIARAERVFNVALYSSWGM